ncbi:hypothetical protein PPACK8108_LOCUS20400 [Phakopsora pachyrhizi]|uniref:Uncharacterized protein n=1 Tax=Phakopsora pachyrhizi TaxID=170000 RepID=A0AAV0BEY1_PHAPC|nr:hypothetical protein PPACK8108_LOCUS20400 [Phakopsora pachyrhizi]
MGEGSQRARLMGEKDCRLFEMNLWWTRVVRMRMGSIVEGGKMYVVISGWGVRGLRNRIRNEARLAEEMDWISAIKLPAEYCNEQVVVLRSRMTAKADSKGFDDEAQGLIELNDISLKESELSLTHHYSILYKDLKSGSTNNDIDRHQQEQNEGEDQEQNKPQPCKGDDSVMMDSHSSVVALSL